MSKNSGVRWSTILILQNIKTSHLQTLCEMTTSFWSINMEFASSHVFYYDHSDEEFVSDDEYNDGITLR